MIHMFLIFLAVMMSCQDKAANVETAVLADPEGLNAEQVELTVVKLTWVDKAEGEIGYRIFLRKPGDPYSVDPLETIGANSSEYIFDGLSAGEEYDFGVQAIAEDVTKHSKIIYLNDYIIPEPETPEEPVKPEDPTPEEPEQPSVPEVDPAKVPEVTSVKESYAYIAVSYKIQKIASSNQEHGICFSADGNPDVNGIKVPGPAISAGAVVLQVVPNAYLEAGKEYQMSVYIKDGEEYIYSTPQTVKLADEPEAVSLVWEKQEYARAEGVEIYKTTSQLNGRNFNAWYAVADPSEVDFRVMYPEEVGSKKTVKTQAEAAGNCLALINGAIYGNVSTF